MKTVLSTLRAQRSAVLAMVTAFVVVLLLIQLWLLVETIEGHLGGVSSIVAPATFASGLCCMAAAWLKPISRSWWAVRNVVCGSGANAMLPVGWLA